MPKRKKDRRRRWQQKQIKEGRCWKCGEPAEPKYNSSGKPVGFRKLCTPHLTADRERTLANYNRKKKLLAA